MANEYKARCFESHPPLIIGPYQIIGGSCSDPITKYADIYIGFDGSMKITKRKYPWHEGIEVYFPIQDRTAPADKVEFKLLVQWTASQLIAGQKVHCGCIGGHGRTGTFFAALVKEMLGDIDAASYVRKNYCEKAIESQEQVNFLASEYGINKIACRDTHHAPYTGGTSTSGKKGIHSSVKANKTEHPDGWNWVTGKVDQKNAKTTGSPIKMSGNIWGSTLR